MKRCLFLLVAVTATSATAADYRDCKDLFVYPTASVVPETKPGGQPWDNGSTADVQLSAKPTGRGDLLPQAIGPKAQDAKPVVTWATVWPAESKNGYWFPMRVGDSLDLWLTDRDALADDPIASGVFEIPKELAKTGFGIFNVKFNEALVVLAVSATDGKRLCSGVDGAPSDVKVTVPEKIIARADSDAFSAIKGHNKCNLNGGTPACISDSYVSIYEDANKDGTPDVIVTGGPFVKGSTSKVVALWLGFDPATRKQVFVGDCDELGLLSKTEFTCTSEGKTSVVSYGGATGGVRAASASEISTSETLTAAGRSKEAQSLLKSLYTAQKMYFSEKGRYSTSFREVGFDVSRGNWFAYFAAPRGETQTRSTEIIAPLAAYSIIAPDENAHPGITVPKGLKEANCPLTFGTSSDGEPIGLGVTGEPPSQEFIGYAIGNVDDDADFDCWSVATFDRRAKSGAKIPAGEPWHEKSDFDEQKATAHSPVP